jgi:hypothetical protein
MRHSAVCVIAEEAKGGELPVGGEPPFLHRPEELHPVVAAVPALEGALDAGCERAEVVLE